MYSDADCGIANIPQRRVKQIHNGMIRLFIITTIAFAKQKLPFMVIVGGFAKHICYPALKILFQTYHLTDVYDEAML